MNVIVDKTLLTLHELARTCRDGEEGYRLAADKEKTSEFSALLLQLSRQRAKMGSELMAKIHELGGTPDDGGSAAAALFRGWINLRAALSHGSSQVILEECGRGEDAAVLSYEEALKSDLMSDVRTLVHRQYQDVLDARGQIRSLIQQKKITPNPVRAGETDELAQTMEGAPD